MSMRLLPKEPVMLRDTAGQDRVIDPTSPWKRHRTLLIVSLAAVLGLGVLLMYVLRYAGAGVSVDRSRLSIATVERGSFVRDIASTDRAWQRSARPCMPPLSARSRSKCTPATPCPR